MPSPQVIDLTLSDDDEIQPDPIRSDQRTPTHTQATNRFRTSSSWGLDYLHLHQSDFSQIAQNWGLMHQEGQVAKNFEIVVDKEWEKEVWSPPLKAMQDAGLL